MANSNHNPKHVFKSKEIKTASDYCSAMFSSLKTLIPPKESIKSSPKLKKYDPKFDKEEELEKELAEVNIAYAATCENVERLQAEYNQLKKEADGKITHEKNKLKKKTDLENEYAILSKSKISSKDEQLMEIKKMRYKVLRNMTQVRFKFEESDNNRLEGLAFNTANNKIKCFTINDLEELKPDQITDHIIAAMETVSQKNYADIPLE